MSTQPVIDLPPSIPPPQTVVSLLQHQASIPPLTGLPPGDVPFMELHMARSVLIDSYSLSASDPPGTTLADNEFPFVPNVLDLPATNFMGINRFSPAYPQQVYFAHGVYWNAKAEYKLWAVKAPAAVGRLRVAYRPPMPFRSTNVYDSSQRDIMKEWDFSVSNEFTFSLNGFNMRNLRNTTATTKLNSQTTNNIHIPLNDYKFGYFKTAITNRYQPGGLFPEEATIYVFQSFSSPQFKVMRAPPLLREESALTTLFNTDL